MADKVTVKAYYAYGRITIKFLPEGKQEWVLVAKKKELPAANEIICKKDNRDDYGAYITLPVQDDNVKKVYQLSTNTVFGVDEGRALWDHLSALGFKASQVTEKKLKNKR